MAIKQTRVADGDLYDFDAATTDWQLLRFGPDGAPNSIERVIRDDYDNDGDDDWIVGFRVEDSGLTCTDFTVSMSGVDAWQKRIWGSDTVVPVGCEENVGIDVEPWSTADEVRPDDNYLIPVGILSKSLANGNDADL